MSSLTHQQRAMVGEVFVPSTFCPWQLCQRHPCTKMLLSDMAGPSALRAPCSAPRLGLACQTGLPISALRCAPLCILA